MSFTRVETLRECVKSLEFKLPSSVQSLVVPRLLPSPYARDLAPETRGERPLIFIHVPKAAGTSICDALNWQNGHIPIGRYKAFDPVRYSASERVAFVRDPGTRLLSAYN